MWPCTAHTLYWWWKLCCAAQACLDLRVQSQNDTKKLAEAKQLVYLRGFTDGVLLAGPHKGEKVRQAPPSSCTTAASTGPPLSGWEHAHPVLLTLTQVQSLLPGLVRLQKETEAVYSLPANTIVGALLVCGVGLVPPTSIAYLSRNSRLRSDSSHILQVSEAKPVIRGELAEAGEAIVYSEPERPVTSRSGDDCVVALTDQWYMTYGEADWEASTRCALSAGPLLKLGCDPSICVGYRRVWHHA